LAEAGAFIYYCALAFLPFAERLCFSPQRFHVFFPAFLQGEVFHLPLFLAR